MRPLPLAMSGQKSDGSRRFRHRTNGDPTSEAAPTPGFSSETPPLVYHRFRPADTESGDASLMKVYLHGEAFQRDSRHFQQPPRRILQQYSSPPLVLRSDDLSPSGEAP
ncbi:unnamed protein product [Victoria cruziana]